MSMTSEQMEALKGAHQQVVQAIEALQLAERVLGAEDKSWMARADVSVFLPEEGWKGSEADRERVENDLATLMKENLPLFAQTLLRVRREAVEAMVVPAQMPPAAPVEAPPDA